MNIGSDEVFYHKGSKLKNGEFSRCVTKDKVVSTLGGDTVVQDIHSGWWLSLLLNGLSIVDFNKTWS